MRGVENMFTDKKLRDDVKELKKEFERLSYEVELIKGKLTSRVLTCNRFPYSHMGEPLLTRDAVDMMIEYFGLGLPENNEIRFVSVKNELPELPKSITQDIVGTFNSVEIENNKGEKKEKKHRKRKFNEFDNYLKKLVDDRIGYLDQLCMEYALTNRDPGWIQKELELAKSLYLQISENKL